MPCEATWLIENRVVYCRSFGVVSVAEVHEISRKTGAMMDAGVKFVHLLADSSDIEKTTFKLQDLAKSIRSIPSSANLGWSLTISPNVMYRFFSSIISQMSGPRHRAFSTIEEAIAFLQTVDSTLPTIPLPVKAGKTSQVDPGTP